MFATFVPFCFSITFVSLACTKLVHLSLHAKTVSPGAFALFLPSVLLPDVLVLVLSRLVLRPRKGVISVAACLLGCIISFILLGAASSQIGFFYETGNEVQWTDALAYAGDKDGLKILLSGLNTVLAAGLIMIVVAWFAKWYLYRAVGSLLVLIGAPITYVWHKCRGPKAYGRRHYDQVAKTDPYDSDSTFDSDDSYDDLEKNDHGSGDSPRESGSTASWVFLAIALVFLGLTTVFRPARPYGMMSATLPVAMMEMFKAKPDMCSEQAALNGNQWPLPDLIEEDLWESPEGHFKGWAPGSNNEHVRLYREFIPEWLPDTIPSGFAKWAQPVADKEAHNDSNSCFEADGTFYNPVSDPMKISNLDSNVIDVLQDAFNDGGVKIKHVALIMMESYREELFPLQQGSDMHSLIVKSHGKADVDEINARLHKLSPVAERITGKSGNFKKTDGSDFDPVVIPQWNDTTEDGFGGINVVGGFTTASLSFKSMAAIHCGAWPMPVDGFEESETQAYQPCIPQVLDLFNQFKGDGASGDFLEQQWMPAFFQSITDGYDRQDQFDEKIGFKHVVTKDRLDEDAKEKGEELEEINYFGYAETVLKSHIKDYIRQAQDEGKRMFLSHFTSTTHHPWGVPKSFESADYLSTKGKMGWHEDFNNYLNSMRFTDAWLGEFLQTLDDFGIANETLVVFVGDHGQAFKEDSERTGTYENGHVSNFRVPITFRHPNIPRVQYNANATSLSILPTILDLLINTGSLNDKDTEAASDLIHDYEGQSLIRPYKASHNGRRAWNFGVINGGARMLSMTSADTTWRIVIPLDGSSQYRFTDLEHDPLELAPLERWSIQELEGAVAKSYGSDAAQWAVDAEAISRWWGHERKRLWGYNPGESGETEETETEEKED